MEKNELFRRATSLIAARDYKAAGDILKQAEEMCGPEDIEMLVALHKFYGTTEDYEMSLKIVGKLLVFGASPQPLLPHRAFNLMKLARYKEALLLCEEYLKIYGDDNKIYEVIIVINKAFGNAMQALPFMEKLMERLKWKPLSDRIFCYSELLMTQAYAQVYRDKQYRKLLADIFETTKKCARQIEPTEYGYFKKLKVAYVSPDFRNHPIGFFIYPVITVMPKHEHSTYCFSLYQPEEPTSENMFGIDLTANFMEHSKFIVIEHMTDERKEKTILREKPDIAFDLSSYTAGNKIELFVRRIAPLQITYLGWPTSTGLASMDYAIVDSNTDPEGAERYYTEKLIRMSRTSLCHTLIPTIKPAEDPPSIQNGYITFGSFGNIRKLTPKSLNMMSRVVNSVEGSRLLLITRLSDEVTEDLYNRVVEAGMQRKNVDIVQSTHGPDYPISYERADIILDTVPFNGATTTCDALNMGVPVVTLVGKTQAARRGMSILRNVGLEELIAYNEDEYVRIASELAADTERLRYYRANLREQKSKSNLADAKAFVQEFAYHIRRVWIDYCREHKLDNVDYSRRTDAELLDELKNARSYTAYDQSEDVLEEYHRLKAVCDTRGIVEVDA